MAKNPYRQPVIFEVEGTSFEVDIDQQVLRQTNDPQNEISFINNMAEYDDHYWLFYDPATKKAAVETTDVNAYKVILVPKLVDLDPEGMAAKYGYTVEQLKGRTDFEVMIDMETLVQRHMGVLPRIDLAGESFVVDLRLQELRHAKFFFPVISLKSFELTSDGWHYEAYYHTADKQVVELDPKLLEFPESVVKLKIPNELGLDPVATAKQYGLAERELLRRHPVQKELKAEVIPLSETHVPALIQRNREALQQEHRQNAQKLKPRHRPKF